ncbi:jg14019 [Pararge aegeria aegeria]|uniref:Jg14019 protein n=1 Tax=Pararge aegeria aegeria TaxID=348720 RepID=A0A8S4R4F3_9NEOP|nr:jg14019 [Pararge aegeria aegeria]
MWAFKRMLAISWTRKVSYEKVLRRVNQRSELLHTIKIRKVAYLGHELLRLIMMGKDAGRRGVGRRKKSWLLNIRERTELYRLAKMDKNLRSRLPTFASRREEEEFRNYC